MRVNTSDIDRVGTPRTIVGTDFAGTVVQLGSAVSSLPGVPGQLKVRSGSLVTSTLTHAHTTPRTQATVVLEARLSFFLLVAVTAPGPSILHHLAMQSQSESPPSAAPGEPQQDPELWFEDGNLVLVAGNVEFRVYKGPFMAQSGFFKDMLSLPQPSPLEGGAASAGGPSPSCAIVHLADSPEDVRHFLRVFVEGAIR